MMLAVFVCMIKAISALTVWSIGLQNNKQSRESCVLVGGSVILDVTISCNKPIDWSVTG